MAVVKAHRRRAQWYSGMATNVVKRSKGMGFAGKRGVFFGSSLLARSENDSIFFTDTSVFVRNMYVFTWLTVIIRKLQFVNVLQSLFGCFSNVVLLYTAY
jgi:hypothetical protein